MVNAILAGVLFSLAALQQTDTVFAVRPDGRLTLESHGGEVRVRTWERDQLRLVAEHGVRDRIEITGSNGRIHMRARSYRGVARSVEIDVTVPRAMSLRIEGVNLDVEARDIGGAVEVETVQGDVTVVGGRRDVALRTVSGDVVLEGTDGRIEVGSTNGDIHVTDVVGELRVETINGDVTLGNVRSDAVDAVTVNGDVEYDGTILDGGRYAFTTHNGDLAVSIPTGASVTVSVFTYHGEFESEFPITLTETAEGGGRFTFVLGGGGARLRLESFGGEILLYRARG